VINLFLIAAIVLLPFSTQAVGEPGVDDLPLPTVIMAVNVVAASVFHTLVYVVAVRRLGAGRLPDLADRGEDHLDQPGPDRLAPQPLHGALAADD
jgi:hypothetical protein